MSFASSFQHQKRLWIDEFVELQEIGVRSWNLLRIFDSSCRQVSPWLSYIFGFVRNEILEPLNPKDRERESHPCVNLHREK